MNTVSDAVRLLRNPATIRSRCAEIAEWVAGGQSRWFMIDDAGLEPTARLVAQVTRRNYPDLRVPYHSRWRHFEAGGVERAAALATPDPAERARAAIDLAVVSVLLDAGAGPDWHWDEPGGGRYTRSEGLGVASFHAFMAGAFSSASSRPRQADAQGLCAVTEARLAELLQVSPDNPLVGLRGRAALLRRLGEALLAAPQTFGSPARPGALFDRLGSTGMVRADAVLGALLEHFSSIWLAPTQLDGVSLGDVWPHPAAGGDGDSAGLVPFHKLSQWLSYSLLEPFAAAGLRIAGLARLTALPEYRNGGLLLDSGWLRLRDPACADHSWQVGDQLVVEWRALTIALIDRLAPRVRALLDLDAERLPLAALLQGGTWSAGRQLAAERRGGLPPLRIDSDGTVF